MSIPAEKDLGAVFSVTRLEVDVMTAECRHDICYRRVNTPVSRVRRGRREEGGGRRESVCQKLPATQIR